MSNQDAFSRRQAFLAAGALTAVWASGAQVLAAEENDIPVREKAAPKSDAKFKWRITGNDKPCQNACGDIPPTPYMVVADQPDVLHAKVLHVIWHKTAPDIEEAIDRVLVDTDIDKAAEKTPHYSHLHKQPHMGITNDLIYSICYFDFCSIGKYELHVTVIWEDVSKIMGSSQINHRRHLETQVFKLESQMCPDCPEGQKKDA
jgi:hypothetical protein